MGTQVDMSGDDLYVNAIYTGLPTGSVTGLAQGAGGSGELARKYVLKGVNFNATNTDNAITLVLPPGTTRWTLEEVIIFNASASISTATFGLFTGTGGTGQTISTAQAITVTGTTAGAANSSMQNTTGTTVWNTGSTLFFRTQTAQGSAATADVVVSIFHLD